MLSITSRFFWAKIAIVTHLRMKLRTCVVPKNTVGTTLAAIVKAVRMDSTGYFGQK